MTNQISRSNDQWGIGSRLGADDAVGDEGGDGEGGGGGKSTDGFVAKTAAWGLPAGWTAMKFPPLVKLRATAGLRSWVMRRIERRVGRSQTSRPCEVLTARRRPSGA